jgi:hypothetical protein
MCAKSKIASLWSCQLELPFHLSPTTRPMSTRMRQYVLDLHNQFKYRAGSEGAAMIIDFFY